jgi:Concanavalin A-like lectin/glucanases superfamily
MDYTLIILGAIVVILIYILYTYFSTATNRVAQNLSLSATNTPIKLTNQPSSYNYTYGIWVYVNTWDTTSPKVIFQRRMKEGTALHFPVDRSAEQISLHLDKTNPTLHAYFSLTGNNELDIVVTNNFPIQAWCFVAISVNQNYVDCYLNGKLVKSVSVSSSGATLSPPVANATVLVGGGTTYKNSKDTESQNFDALITQFTYVPNSSSPQDIWTTYLKGNGTNPLTSWFTTYGVTVDLTKNGSPANSITLF